MGDAGPHLGKGHVLQCDHLGLLLLNVQLGGVLSQHAEGDHVLDVVLEHPGRPAMSPVGLTSAMAVNLALGNNSSILKLDYT